MRRLDYRYDEDKINSGFATAKDAIDNLWQGNLPRYDEFMTPLHAYRYHICHVDFSQKLFRLAIERSADTNSYLPTTNRVLCLFDVGAGSLAAQFGLVIAITHLVKDADSIPKLKVISIDPSKEMFSFGRRLWKRFVKIINSNSELQSLAYVCRRLTMEYTTGDSPDRMADVYENSNSQTVWLSAIHSFYNHSTSRPAVNSKIRQILNNTNCQVAVLSVFSGKANLMKTMLPNFNEFNRFEVNLEEPKDFRSFGLAHWSKDARFNPNGLDGIETQFRSKG